MADENKKAGGLLGGVVGGVVGGVDSILTGGDKAKGQGGLLGGLNSTVGKTTEGVGNTLNQTTEGVGDTAGSATEGVGNVGKGVTDTLGNTVKGATGAGKPKKRFSLALALVSLAATVAAKDYEFDMFYPSPPDTGCAGEAEPISDNGKRGCSGYFKHGAASTWRSSNLKYGCVVTLYKDKSC
ncbi:hypothetical protein F4818DRAFT_444422 [Hypoxylon cercidicola]|nr:hypothetical protein F4818DRAFT_444422 [Hypoxylon cercidicola]